MCVYIYIHLLMCLKVGCMYIHVNYIHHGSHGLLLFQVSVAYASLRLFSQTLFGGSLRVCGALRALVAVEACKTQTQDEDPACVYICKYVRYNNYNNLYLYVYTYICIHIWRLAFLGCLGSPSLGSNGLYDHNNNTTTCLKPPQSPLKEPHKSL